MYIIALSHHGHACDRTYPTEAMVIAVISCAGTDDVVELPDTVA